jgi:hypothetical protein
LLLLLNLLLHRLAPHFTDSTAPTLKQVSLAAKRAESIMIHEEGK